MSAPVEESTRPGEPTGTIDQPPRPKIPPTVLSETDINRFTVTTANKNEAIRQLSAARVVDMLTSSSLPDNGNAPDLNDDQSLKSASRRFFQKLDPTYPAYMIRRQQELNLARLEREYAIKCLKTRLITDNIQRIIVVLGSKGGVGKSPLATHLAALLKWISDVAVAIIDGNENHGTVDLLMGIRRGSNPLLRDVMADHDLIMDHHTACITLPRHFQTGLSVLLSNPNVVKSDFGMAEYISMFMQILAGYHSLVADTGNGNENPSNEGSFLMASVALFSALATKPSSFNTLLTTMVAFHRLGHAAKLQEQSLVVISATSEDDTLESVFEKIYAVAVEMTAKGYNRKTQEMESELWTDDPDQLLRDLGFTYDDTKKEFTYDNIYLVPYSQWIADDNIVSILPEETGLETLNAYADILLRIYTMTVQTEDVKLAEINRRLAERGEPQREISDALSKIAEKITRDVLSAIRTEVAPDIKSQVTKEVTTALHDNGFA